jgi:hypothetical protein
MGDLKLRGFYVDITNEGIITPKRMNDDNYNKLKDVFNCALLNQSASIIDSIPDQVKKEFLKAMQKMIKTQKKPMYSTFKSVKSTLGNFKNYEEITKGQVIRLSILCMENSRSLFEVSQILDKNGRGYNNNGLFGTAAALLAISREEYLKAIIFSLVSSGYAVITRKPVKGKYAIHHSQIICHSCKDSLAVWNDVTSIAKTARIPGGATLEQEREEIKKIISSPIPEGKDEPFLGMGVPSEKLEKVKKYFEIASNLWGIKESGLYVFVSEDSAQSPANFRPIMYHIVEDIVARAVLPFHPFEDYANFNLKKTPDFMLIDEVEMMTPIICPHRGIKRVMSEIVIYKDPTSN